MSVCAHSTPRAPRPGRTAVALAAAVLFLAACTSTPQASRERDSLAKEFLTHPNAATLYVYRSPFNW